MRKLSLIFIVLISASSFASVDLKELNTVVYSDMTKNDSKRFCSKGSSVNSNICLMTLKNAQKFCAEKGLKLPSALDFAKMASSYGAYVGTEKCGVSRTCQKITALNEDIFYYNSGGAYIENILPGYWFHTSSLRERGANFHFNSDSGYMQSASEENLGNVACISK